MTETMTEAADHLLDGRDEPHVLETCHDSEHEQRHAAAVLEDACLAFGTLEVLHQVNLTVRREAVTAVVGPNGSGKTSLLRMLAGFCPPSVGTICWHEVERVAMAEQADEKAAWMPLRVWDVLVMGRYGHSGLVGRFRKRDKEIVAEAAERMDVSRLLNRQMGQLSVGQRRRVRLALCLAQEADMLLLDEPEGGLDIASNQRIFAEMEREKQRGAAVVFATHKLEEAANSDYAVLLNKGVVAQGPAAEVLRRDQLSRVFCGEALERMLVQECWG